MAAGRRDDASSVVAEEEAGGGFLVISMAVSLFAAFVGDCVGSALDRE